MIVLPAMPPEQTASWFARFTGALTGLGFTSGGVSGEGLEHRWVRGGASIDVLLPDGIGERTSLRPGVTGSPTLQTAGGTQALARSETAELTRKDRHRLRVMVAAVQEDRALLLDLTDADDGMARIAVAADL